MRKNLIKDKSLKRTIKGIYLPEKNWKILNRHAYKLERSTNWLVTKIIDSWISKHKKELKTVLRSAAEKNKLW